MTPSILTVVILFLSFSKIHSEECINIGGRWTCSKIELKAGTPLKINKGFGESVKSIQFVDSILPTIYSNVFSTLKNTDSIILRSNEIKIIEKDAFRALTNLKHLYLSRNKISEIHHDTFRDLISLEELRIDNNYLTSLPRNCFSKLTKLTVLALSHNHITVIPKKLFFSLVSLTHLFFTNNNLSDLSPDLFLNTKELQMLDLSANKLTELKYGALNGLSNLLLLNLHENNLTVLDTETLLEYLPNLEKVTLSSNSWTCSSLKETIEKLIYQNVTILDSTVQDTPNVNGISCINKQQETIENNNSDSLNFSEFFKKLQHFTMDAKITFPET